MTKINTTPRRNWFTDNPFFVNKDAYDGFVEAMLDAADEGELPKCFEHGEPENLTAQDFKWFSQKFKHDTGLSIEFRLMTCDHCDRLHCLMIVDEAEEETGSDEYAWN